MTIFHAGSLAAPFGDAESQFEQETGIQVSREAKGSVGSMKKITEQGRKADVLGVSDFRLIRDSMVPKFADWYTIFTTNAMAIAYTADSKHADQFSKDNWWEILSKEDVTVAHSDPAVDPNGYRSVMAMQLGAIPLSGEKLYDDSTVKAMEDVATVPSGTETNMIGQLEAGKLDYAWEYASAGANHDVEVLSLQPAVDLSRATAKYAAHYAKAEVKAAGNTYTGAPIAYGMCVPSVAEHPDLGARWVEYMITDPGRKILTDNGLRPVSPAVVPKADADSVPDTVMSNATAEESLGPMTL